VSGRAIHKRRHGCYESKCNGGPRRCERLGKLGRGKQRPYRLRIMKQCSYGENRAAQPKGCATKNELAALYAMAR
jgi:hypothetical protein